MNIERYVMETIEPYHLYLGTIASSVYFANGSMTLRRNDDLYTFVAIEGNEIRILNEKHAIINTNEVFVFQCKNRFLRLRLKEMMLIPRFMELMIEVMATIEEQLEKATYPIGKAIPQTSKKEPVQTNTVTSQLIVEVITREQQLKVLDEEINEALDNRDKARFMELTKRRSELTNE